jgi:hypothetical protein
MVQENTPGRVGHWVCGWRCNCGAGVRFHVVGNSNLDGDFDRLGALTEDIRRARYESALAHMSASHLVTIQGIEFKETL